MPNVWEVLQEIATATHSIRQLEEDLRDLRMELEPRLRNLEIQVARLQEAQQTVRETVKAEIALSVAELRVRYAESMSAGPPGRPVLPEETVPEGP
ncbi:MAG: hypothetical protein HY318_17935 [Armatimonadetes bacterium]|nr:hypothetical protein [Armatimonadota bacterium]